MNSEVRKAINRIKKEKRLIIKRMNFKLEPYLKYGGYGTNFKFNMFGRIGTTGDHRSYKVIGAENNSLRQEGIIGFYNGGVINDIFVGLATTRFEDYTLKDLVSIQKMLDKTIPRMENNAF